MSAGIAKEDVAHVARLARIHLSEKEVEKFTGELAGILRYVSELQKVDTRGVLPTAHAVGEVNVLREDTVRLQTSNVRDVLLDALPTREGEYVKVKSVFTNE